MGGGGGGARGLLLAPGTLGPSLLSHSTSNPQRMSDPHTTHTWRKERNGMEVWGGGGAGVAAWTHCELEKGDLVISCPSMQSLLLHQ